MVHGDWAAAEVELRHGFDELTSMGDKNYLAIVAGWLAHCLYRLGRLDEADECAAICERSAAKNLIAARVLWSGGRAVLLARRGDLEDGRGAREGGGRDRARDRARGHADGRAHGPRGGASHRWP